MVETRGMRPHLVEGTTCMNGTVTGDVIVIPHGGEASSPMTGDDGFQGERPVAARGAAMNDNQVNPPVVLVLRTIQNSIAHIRHRLGSQMLPL